MLLIKLRIFFYKITGIVVGRPVKPFDELSDRSKRRKQWRESAEPATPDGNTEASKILKDITISPRRGARYKNAFVYHSNARNIITVFQDV